MPTTNFSKISGTISMQVGTQALRHYRDTSITYQFNDALSSVWLKMGNDEWTVAYSDLRVNGQTPSTTSEARTLMAALFSTP
jgi:hypothetical protein